MEGVVNESDGGKDFLRRFLTGLFIVAGLVAIVVSFLWFAVDFMAASIYSPNLDQAQQVSDFNDLAYIGESLARYHLRFGVPALVTAIALLVFAVALNNRTGSVRPALISGAVALIMVALLLAQGFTWLLGLGFLTIAATLYLVTRWEWEQAPDQASSIPEIASIDAAADTAIGDETVNETVTVVEADQDVAASDAEAENWPKEPMLPGDLAALDEDLDEEPPVPAVASDALKAQLPEADESEKEPALLAADARPSSGAEDSSLGLDFDSDLNLELEQDYQLAQGIEDGPDPFDVLSQADLGIDSDEFEPKTIETAAAIEAEVLGRTALDQADTQEVEAIIGEVAAEQAKDSMNAVEDTGSIDTNSVESGKPLAAAPVFDPQDLARQEALLPAPRHRIWTLFDWLVLAVIVVSIGLLIFMNL